MGKTLISSGVPTPPEDSGVVIPQPTGGKTLLSTIRGKDGDPGEDAYEIAVENGFEGTEIEWLESLDGLDGSDAYSIALLEGFIGTRAEWLESLHGPKGDNAYQVAVSAGFPGTKEQWLDSLEGLDGEDGFSPYLTKTATHIQVQYFTIDGEPASEVLDLVPLDEISGTDGRDPYKIALENGFVGTEARWIASLRGIDGYTPVLTVTETHIQLHYTRGDEVTEPEDLISLEDLTGTSGTNGGMPRLRKTTTHFQWAISFYDEEPVEWFNLASIEELKGGKGDKGDFPYVRQATPPTDKTLLWLDTSADSENFPSSDEPINWFPQSAVGSFEFIIPSIVGTGAATVRSGSIAHPIYLPANRTYDRFVIRCVTAQAASGMGFTIYRWDGTIWKHLNVGTFDMSASGLRQLSGRWELPKGRYVFAFSLMNSSSYTFIGGVPANVPGFPYGSPNPAAGGAANFGDTRHSVWWAHTQLVPPAVDLTGVDSASLTAAGMLNSPNSWGAGHPPALYGRTAV